jgi:hypothetical protein
MKSHRWIVLCVCCATLHCGSIGIVKATTLGKEDSVADGTTETSAMAIKDANADSWLVSRKLMQGRV